MRGTSNGVAERNGTQRKNTTIRLSEARDVTPPVDPVQAVKQSLVMTLYGQIGEDDVAQLVDSIKTKALKGDRHAERLLLDIITKAAGHWPGGRDRVVEKTVVMEPGAKQLRLLCAYAIRHEGSMSLSALATLVGMAEEDAERLLDGCWFDATARGYVLTAEGKQAVG
jgi:hypothetical protein